MQARVTGLVRESYGRLLALSPDAGLSALDAIADPAVERFQPAWAARARLLVTAGRPAAAAKAYRAAIDLSTDAGVVKYLQRRLVAVARR